MNIKKQNVVYVPNIEEGKYWAEYPDDSENGFWLKPIEQVFLLTEEELEKTISLFSAYLILKGNPDLPMAENIKDFIQLITK